MSGIRYVWLVCGLAILIVDTLGSLAARHWGFAYGNLIAVSYMLYFCAGVGGGRLAGIGAGGVAGGLTALTDATLGWAISSGLRTTPGPGTLTPLTTFLVVLGVVLGVVFTGSVLGLAGGALGKLVHRSFAADG